MSKKYQVNNKFLAAVLRLIEFTDCALAFHERWEKFCADQDYEPYLDRVRRPKS